MPPTLYRFFSDHHYDTFFFECQDYSKGIIYGSRDCTGSDSVPASGSNGSKDGSVPDNIFRDTAYYGGNWKRACICYLDSFKKGNCRAELKNFQGKNSKTF